uniref:Putative serine carboxypeptidase s28 n=1 Tax=Corethrella appendiculata TaxID=1370023 RepID=U5EWL6_9DIPT
MKFCYCYFIFIVIILIKFTNGNSTTAKHVITDYMMMRLDNFNPQDNRMWKMRFMYNSFYYQPGGPIIILVQSRRAISAHWLQSSRVTEIAKELNGTMYFFENRYFGESKPTTDLAIENLKFLSTSQTLADLARFVAAVKSKVAGHLGIIVIGGSYGGIIATWFRQKYPHLVDGVWSSCAPVLMKLNFYKYRETVSEVVKKLGGVDCSSKLKTIFVNLPNAITKDLVKVKRLFGLCDSVDLSNQLNLYKFYDWVTDIFSGMVQSRRLSISPTCKVLANSTDDLIFLSTLFNQTYRGKKQDIPYPCMYCGYTKNIDYLKSTSYQTNNRRQNFYQNCAEIGLFHTTDSENQIFGTLLPVEYYLQMCKNIFGVFNNETLQHYIDHTNTVYGGFNLGATNVFSTQGELDPWRPLGLQSNANENSPVVVVKGMSHCEDLHQIYSWDPIPVKTVKSKALELIKKWLLEVKVTANSNKKKL